MKFVFIAIAIFINFFNHSFIKSEEKILSAENGIENIARKESITEEKTEIKKIHIVKSGDTISSISKFYSINKDLIIKLNNLKDENYIFVGQNLIISESSENLTKQSDLIKNYHIVQTGENLTDISNKYNLKVKELIEINNINNADYIKIGQKLTITKKNTLNLEKYDEWKDDPNMISDVMRFLDNVLSDFINKAPDQFKDAKYSAERERSVGLGVMGFHSFLQKHRIPLESVMAKSWNKKIFKQIDEQVNKASKELAEERGACPDAAEYGFNERFSNKTAIAPTASISIICGGASPGVEPIAANSYTHKTLSGSFNVRNRYLEEILESHGKNDDETWSTITTNQGSVSHLDFLTDLEKDVFKTAFELNQKWIVELSGDRTQYISQAQSVNLFLPADVHKKELHRIHFDAWKKGLKSLYYCRSKSIQRAENINNAKSTDVTANVYKSKNQQTNDQPEYEECLSCQ